MIRVYVTEDWIGRAAKIAVVREDEDRVTHILRTEAHGGTAWVEVPSEIIEVAPTLTLPVEVAQALLQALVGHFHGAEDTRALRRDYDAERARVDKLIDAMIGPPRGV